MGGLADFMAGAGQVYGGYNEAEAIAQKIRQQKIAEERAAIELAGQKRLEDFNREASTGLRDFLPGGSRATTVTVPGDDAVAPPVRFDDEGNPMPLVSEGTPKSATSENRMGALEFMHRAALDAGLPDKAEAIQKRISSFKSEGVLETAQAVLAGKSEDEIRDTFNKQGAVRLTRVQRVPGSDSAIVGVTESGKPVQFDAANAMRSLLSPKDWASDDSKAEVRAVKEKELENRMGIADKLASTRMELGTAKNETDRMRAENDRVRAEAYRNRQARTGGPKPPDPVKARNERRKFNADVSRYAKEEAKFTDEDSGKTVVDQETANQIAGLSIVLAQENPDLLGDPRAAAQAAADRLAELKSKAKWKADREWDGAAETSGQDVETFQGVSMPDGGKEGKDAYIKRRTGELVKNLLRGTRSSGDVAESPPKQYPDAKKAPDGFWYVKRDGKTYKVTED